MERIKAIFESEKPVKWLFYGDSITHGAVHTYGGRDYPELFSERVRFEMGRTMDIVINTAISGNNTRSLLAGFDWRVKQFNPQIVFIMIGMNDCSDNNDISLEEFGRNLKNLCDQIKEINGLPVLQTTCPILPNTAPDRSPNLAKFMDKIRDVAKEYNLPIIDHHKYWLENIDKLYCWMSNEFHPNAEGHRIFAHFLLKEIGIFDKNSCTCRLFTP